MDELRDARRALGVTPLAPRDEVTKAFRRAARRHHPDHGGDPAQFVRIERAYRIARASAPRRVHHNYVLVDGDPPGPVVARPRPSPSVPAPRSFAEVLTTQLRRHGVGSI